MSERKSWAKYVTIGCTVVLLLGACGMGLVYYSCDAAYQAARAPSDAARAFLVDLREGRVEAAYARTTEDFRAQNDLAAFRALLDDHPELRAHTDATFTSHMIDPDGATVGGFLQVGERPVGIHLRMRENADGTYSVDGLMLEPAAAPVLPLPDATP